MKTLKLVLSAFALITLAVAPLIASDDPTQDSTSNEPAKAKEITWHSYDKGLAKAAEENKYVFIDFTAKWCGYCRKMERETFSQQNIIDILNNDFVAIKVDGDSENELDIAGYKITERNLTRMEYGVSGYPTFWFLTNDGTKLATIKGYRDLRYMESAFGQIKAYRDSVNSAPPQPTENK